MTDTVFRAGRGVINSFTVPGVTVWTLDTSGPYYRGINTCHELLHIGSIGKFLLFMVLGALKGSSSDPKIIPQ